MSASSCDFDADKILQFNINEVVYRSTRGSGHTSRDLAALHGSNDDGDSFRCDCHSVPTQYPLVNRDPRVRAMRSWGVPGEWEDLCECCGPIPCHLYPQHNASIFWPGGHRNAPDYVNQYIYDATKIHNDQDALYTSSGETPSFENEDDVRDFVVHLYDEDCDDNDNGRNIRPAARERRLSAAFNDVV